MRTPIVLAHGGAESNPEHADGPQRAARRGAKVVEEGGSALDAVVEAVRFLEADERFNAGRGSAVRLDGHTIQMDACCLDSTGRLGAVAAVDGVLHPVLVARALVGTPHTMLVGEGARFFARRVGVEEGDLTTPRALDHFDRLRDRMRDDAHEPGETEWNRDALRELWNFDASFYSLYGTTSRRPQEKTVAPSTVGAVAFDGETFAAATSTGGQTAALLGRVGDAVLPGCGLEADERGAVVVSGAGEHIARARVASRVLRRLEAGATPDDVVKEALGWVPEHAPLALVVLDAQGGAAGGGRTALPWAQAQAAGRPAQEAQATP